ncbi:hypothetical protein ADP71_02380 [Vitreoscilla sp. C1]|uniref:class I SAM-dependent methyltransferase n=1 Tax=Vitreoscilla sp. (strain C1) TaxID=96942 RepID=UPI000CDC5D56|nr:class I SAM-dependent methyltransferase [Vitreoscilla sp. C1]AUZ04058.1 hypothetical protein ADP71_02380 [Vitreoscilla sp. C1]
MNQTIQYYDEHAQEFYADTVNVSMDNVYGQFLSHLPTTGRLLDVGCGSGRDAHYFKQQGYEVIAMDASITLCELASKLLNQPVLNMQFQDIHWQNHFHGIWACASLLHCPENELPEVLRKLQDALIIGGVMYVSFKYGDSSREKGGRIFTDMNENTLQVAINSLNLQIKKLWKTSDNRVDKNDIWINCLLVKY